MILYKIIQLAFKNIMNSRKKSLSAILSVASGFLALNLFQAYIVDTNILFDQTYENRSMLGHLLIRKDSRLDLTSLEEQKEITKFLSENTNNIEEAVRFLNFTGTLNSGSVQTVFAGYGYDVEEGKKIRGASWQWNVLAGEPLDQGANTRGLLLGRRLAEIVKCKETEHLDVLISKTGYEAKARGFACENPSLQLSISTQTGQVNASELKVLGILDGVFRDIDERLVVTSLREAQSLLHSDEISMIALRLKDADKDEDLKARFSQTVQKKYPLLQLKSWKEYEIGDFYNKSINFLFIFRNFITLVVISIGALSVMTTFYRLVFERTREIGTLLSVGFKSKHIFTLIISEAFFLSLLGVAIGVVASYLVAVLVNSLEIPYKLGMLSEAVPFAMTIQFKMLLLSALTLIFISIGICAFPVKRALKMKVSDALRE